MSKPIPMSVAEFDNWRTHYDTMTVQDHHTFYDRVEQTYPNKTFWTPKFLTTLKEFLRMTPIRRVIEIGGYKGDLAALILPDHPEIEHWENYEICPSLGKDQHCSDPRYHFCCPDQFAWEIRAEGDLLIASHVLEHIKFVQIQQLLTHWQFTHAIIEYPVKYNNQIDWRGYNGSHVVEKGRQQLIDFMESIGYYIHPLTQYTQFTFLMSKDCKPKYPLGIRSDVLPYHDPPCPAWECWMTRKEIAALKILAFNKLYGEIGSFDGFSLWHVAQTAKELIAIDSEDTSDRRYPTIMHNVVMPHADKITLFKRKAEDIAHYFAEGLFDLLLIDGDHNYEHVAMDYYHYAPKVKVGGIIAFHDYDYPGVREVVDHLDERMEFAGICETLIWFKRVK